MAVTVAHGLEQHLRATVMLLIRSDDPQLERLRGLPPGPAGLAPGRFELTIGEPEQWVPGHPDHKAVRAPARRILPL